MHYAKSREASLYALPITYYLNELDERWILLVFKSATQPGKISFKYRRRLKEIKERKNETIKMGINKEKKKGEEDGRREEN